jgi:catechol 2,3-dioxygenase-like lactoylglutathione lyase family enzyme
MGSHLGEEWMMLSSAPVAPTLAVNDLERARRFYEDKLGFEVEVQAAETIRYRCGNGTGLAIFERPMTPIDRTVAAFEVVDIEAEVVELRSRGVEVEGVIMLATASRPPQLPRAKERLGCAR